MCSALKKEVEELIAKVKELCEAKVHRHETVGENVQKIRELA